MNNKEIGKLGENLANNYLLKGGYLILARNHKEAFDEIDIVARDQKGTLVFCEVKTLNNRGSYPEAFMPEDNLSYRKLRKLVRGARVFLAKHPEAVWEKRGWQIDLIAVTLREDHVAEIRHYKNI